MNIIKSLFENKKITTRKILVSIISNLLFYLIFNFKNINYYFNNSSFINALNNIGNYIFLLIIILLIFIILYINQYKYSSEINSYVEKTKDYLFIMIYGIVFYFIGALICDILLITINLIILRQFTYFLFEALLRALLFTILYSIILSIVVCSNHQSSRSDNYGIISIVQFILALFLYILIDESSIILFLLLILLASCISTLSFYTTRIFLYAFKSRSNKLYLIDKFSNKKMITYFSFIYFIVIVVGIILFETINFYVKKEVDLLSLITIIVFSLICLICSTYLYIINRKNYIIANENNINTLRNMNISSKNISILISNNISITFFVSFFYVSIIGFLYLYYIKANINSDLTKYFINFTYSEYIIFAIIYMLVYFFMIKINSFNMNDLIIGGDEYGKKY